MAKKGLLILILLILGGALLGIFYPGLAIAGAVVIWISDWIYWGGFSSGNPYKSMARDDIPDWGQTQQYKEEADKQDHTDLETIIFIFLIGLLWMMFGIVFSFYITI